MIRADGKITGKISPTVNIKGGMSNQFAWNYEKLDNLPSIEGNTLIGDKTFRQLGMDTLTVQEIEQILYLG